VLNTTKTEKDNLQTTHDQNYRWRRGRTKGNKHISHSWS